MRFPKRGQSDGFKVTSQGGRAAKNSVQLCSITESQKLSKPSSGNQSQQRL
jgi:hypothetical protein